jgi:hypothetical protein
MAHNPSVGEEHQQRLSADGTSKFIIHHSHFKFYRSPGVVGLSRSMAHNSFVGEEHQQRQRLCAGGTSKFTIHHSPFTIHHSHFKFYRSPGVVGCPAAWLTTPLLVKNTNKGKDCARAALQNSPFTIQCRFLKNIHRGL